MRLPVPPKFTASFTQQEPISEEAIASAVEVLRSGRLHRYNTVGNQRSEVSLLEEEFAAYQGRQYALACASGGYAMQTALRCAGLQKDEIVLTNAFTLAPVPGAIVGAGGQAVFVEICDNLTIDLDDLDVKAKNTGARFLLLSLMRGHLPDMEALMRIVKKHNLLLIEDCAHTMGAQWNGIKSGNFGVAGCFSTQTYKHMNSGEGGLLVSNDAEFMARAIIYSGSYMNYTMHGAAPDPRVFADIRLDTPNQSGRMDNLRAAILRPQLKRIGDNIRRWNERYHTIADILKTVAVINLPKRPVEEFFVGSSIQFLIPNITAKDAQTFVDINHEKGVDVKWFGRKEPLAFTSNHKSWRYINPQTLPHTDSILGTLFDMRIPLTFSLDDCTQVAEIIRYCANQIQKEAA